MRRQTLAYTASAKWKRSPLFGKWEGCERDGLLKTWRSNPLLRVSGFIQQAVQKSLENAAEFRAIVEEALKKTGGPLKPKERAWARKMLSARRRGTRPRTAA